MADVRIVAEFCGRGHHPQQRCVPVCAIGAEIRVRRIAAVDGIGGDSSNGPSTSPPAAG